MWMRNQPRQGLIVSSKFVHLFVHLAVLVGACAVLILATILIPTRVQAAGPALPSGTMQAKAVTLCMECHDAHIIVQQRMAKPAWIKEVEKMTRWGATVAPEDKDALVDYFSLNFGVDVPAYEATMTAATRSAKKAKP